ncbi:LytTR family DNA-binding domain-containing protein [Sphingobacterium griseoflavum]|uniref:LytTR family DNA-binding domain-containing protein n=1 Tax=Sphingobacterium griseoflavum TaxID=1474952 RepID=UPI0016769EB2|nr:LytTR family DNA-binding domain-containing protein [Sphingobacterium griseoflavum]
MKKLTSQFCVENKVLYFPFYVQFIISFILAYSFYCIASSHLLDQMEDTMDDVAFMFIFLLIILFSGTLQKLTVCLDRGRPWLLCLPNRFFLQLLFGIAIPALLATACMVFFFSLVTDEWSSTFSYISALYPALFIVGCIVNVVYFVWFFVKFSFFAARQYGEKHHKLALLCDQLRKIREEQQASCWDEVEVRYGFRRQLLGVKDIGVFEASAGGRSCVLRQGGKRYDFDYSLDALAARLDPRAFYKVNRRYIINRAVICGYRDTPNGRVIVTLSEDLQDVREIAVSRGIAKAFKSWYRKCSC